jgi:fatty acid desaturase
MDGWWKARHNTHHMVTNEVGNDPDVRTEPVFHFFDANSGKDRKHMPLQHVFFTLLLGALDLFWRYESIMVINKNWKTQKLIAARLCVHYLFLFGLVLYSDVTVFDIAVLMYVRGFMTAIVVFANHYPEDRLPSDHSMGLFEQTLRTSRNTSGVLTHCEAGWARSLFNESTGFLSMQIEHHLVPTWPSGNLMQLRPHIRALAKKYDLPYKESSLLFALWENITTKLSDVPLEHIKNIN